MKRFLLLIAVVLVSVSTTFSQIAQDFANVPNIHSLTNKCWQFYGTALVSPADSYDKYLSLTSPTINGTSWIRTPYIHLNTASTINFAYQLSEPLSGKATRTITVSLIGLDGKPTLVKELTLGEQDGTKPFLFSAVSPINGALRLSIAVTASGNESTSLSVDNFKIDGTFDYNPPYACKDNEDGMTSIHYLKNFKGQVSAGRVHLQWTVVENENNGYFEIERSTDGRNYQAAATLKATARVAVEDYTHEEVLSNSAYYRLKLVSKSGIRMYSNVLFFKSTASGQDLSVLQNPVQQTLKLGFNAERKATAVVSLYNAAGTRVFHRQFDVQKDYNRPVFTLDAQMKSGVYFVEVVSDQTRLTTKLLKE